MSATAQLRLVTAHGRHSLRAPEPADEHVINVILEADERLLLSVVEAARRLGIGRTRTLMYELLGTGTIQSMPARPLPKVPVPALPHVVVSHRRGPHLL